MKYIVLSLVILIISCSDENNPATEKLTTDCSINSKVFVRGTSMLGIFNDSDELILQKDYYNCNTVEIGDIVVFNYRKTKNAIKQVFAKAGDKITIENNFILINNQKIKNIKNEFYQVDKVGVSYIRLAKQLGQINQNDIINRGYYLVLGTAKIGGYDSRRMSLIPLKSIIGKIK